MRLAQSPAVNDLMRDETGGALHAISPQPIAAAIGSLFAVTLTLATGCGGGGAEPIAPTSDYAISASPSTVVINAGGMGYLGVSVSRTNFSGFVTLAVDAPPAGITATFNSGTTDKTWVTATVNVEPSVAPGSYTLTIRGSASGLSTNASNGSGERVTSLILTVAPPKPPTLFVTLFATPDSMILGRGATVSSEMMIFSSLVSDVSFNVVAAPPGITGVFGAQERSGQNVRSMVSITVASTVEPGTYGVVVQGTTSGITRSMIVRVIVAAQSSFTLSAPATVTAPQGTSSAVGIQISRTNFTGGVTFQLEGSLPAGLTHRLPATPATVNVAALVLDVLATAPLGTYTVTVRGSAPGYPDQRVTLQVTVTILSTYSIKATPDRFQSYKGGTVTTTITAVRTNWPNPITLRLGTLPDGLSGTLSETVLDGSRLSSTLTVNIPLTLPYTGGVSITVSGQSDTLITVARVSGGISATGIYRLSPSPASLVIQQGSSGTFNLSATRESYFGPISLSFTGTPSGVTVSMPENPFSGDSLAVTVTVGTGVAPDNYRLTIASTGSGPNVQPETTSFDLVVPAPAEGTGDSSNASAIRARLPR
jgi:hypothetical protein